MIFQEKYMKKLLKKFNIGDANPINKPIGTSSKINIDEPCPSVNQTMYRGIIGYVIYLTTSRPDIVFNVGMCARFHACPTESHLKVAK